jgi:hypothetical protein
LESTNSWVLDGAASGAAQAAEQEISKKKEKRNKVERICKITYPKNLIDKMQGLNCIDYVRLT